MPSFKTPTRQQIETAVQRMRSPEFAAYFLSRLNNPKWIPALEENGLLASPPPAIPVEGGYVRYPHWPASKYLARMASEAPAEVAAVFAKIETDNAFIIGDMLDAALAMPADVSSSLVPVIRRTAREGTLWIHLKDANDLCVRLAEAGELDAAMELAEALFGTRFEEGRMKTRRNDEYWFKIGLKKVIPVLAGARARVFLPKLCDWLKLSIDAREKRYGSVDSGSDYSYVWRPAIEEHKENQDYNFACLMVGFVRQGFEQAIRGAWLSLDEALQIVERYSYVVFKRLRIHLIGQFADQNLALARQVMLNRELFEDYECKHEYAMLVGKRFDKLEPAQQAQWLRWVHDGPTGKEAEALDDSDDRDLSERRRSYWRLNRLHWVRHHLTGEDEHLYQRMLQEYGEPDMADLNVRTGPARYGEDSPMTVDDLAAMTFERAVDAVALWKPVGSCLERPTVDALASTFGRYVATNPNHFSTKARILIDRPAPFVREFTRQMSEAVKAGHEIDLAAVLDLCRWAVDRPIGERTAPVQEHEFLVDKDWQWTRDNISELTERICKAKSGDVPKYPQEDLREQLWGLIRNLSHDPAESYIVHNTSQDDPRIRDYLDLGTNSPRGKALEAAFEYARWVANHVKQSEGGREIIPGGFGIMPEVRQMLEWQIAAENRSFEALSVIGSNLALIYWIDKQWLAENAERIFLLEAVERTPSTADGWAAWNAFLVWIRPHIEYYRVFKSQFAYAVEQAAKVKLPQGGGEQPMYHLGEHLVLLYGRGQLGLDDDGGLLRRLFQNSHSDIKRHAIGFVGESIGGDKEVPNDVITRFMILWDFYWTTSGKRDLKQKTDEYFFGTWFSCGRFPKSWALGWLERFVEVVPAPEPCEAVAEKLAEIAPVDIVKSVRILDRVIHGDREGWHIDGWVDSAKKILKEAMGIRGEAQQLAVELINYLGRRGYTDFGQLLRD